MPKKGDWADAVSFRTCLHKRGSNVLLWFDESNKYDAILTEENFLF